MGFHSIETSKDVNATPSGHVLPEQPQTPIPTTQENQMVCSARSCYPNTFIKIRKLEQKCIYQDTNPYLQFIPSVAYLLPPTPLNGVLIPPPLPLSPSTSPSRLLSTNLIPRPSGVPGTFLGGSKSVSTSLHRTFKPLALPLGGRGCCVGK